jgi:hypothetical protein
LAARCSAALDCAADKDATFQHPNRTSRKLIPSDTSHLTPKVLHKQVQHYTHLEGSHVEARQQLCRHAIGWRVHCARALLNHLCALQDGVNVLLQQPFAALSTALLSGLEQVLSTKPAVSRSTAR